MKPHTSQIGYRSKAFTLIELLIVIAIIALLVGILLPALGKARQAAQSVVCKSIERQMGFAQNAYCNDWKEYFPGPNTSGADGQLSNGALYLFDKTATTPTTTHDWMSPMFGDAAGLSTNRAQRTKQLFERYGCAAAKIENDTLFGSAGDAAQFQTLFQQEGFGQISHLSPASFHYFSRPQVALQFLYQGVQLRGGFTTPVAVNDNYRPRLDKVGIQASNKIFAADGTRYFDPPRLDFDVNPNPGIYGSFTDSGPIFQNSTAYGRGHVGNPINQKLSFRHPGQVINTLYFDGHAGNLSSRQAWTDATPWYPGGSVYNGTSGTPESQAFHNAGDRLP